MIQIIPLLQTYGYLGVFAGSIVEGEAVLFLGGILAHHDVVNLNFFFVFLAAACGAFVGDNAWFWLGRYRRAFVHSKLPGAAKRAERIFAALEHRPRVFAASMRFMYGFRSLVPLSLGLSKIPARLFVFWDAVGSLVWSAVITGAGYYAGGFLSSFFGRLHGREVRVAIVVALTMVAAYIIYRVFAQGARIVTRAPDDTALL